MNKNNILDLPQNNNSSSIEPGTLPKQFSLGNNGNGGGNMNDKYVTHQELDTNTEKILHKMDNRFDDLTHKIEQQFSDIKLNINDTKHEAHSSNWKANWILGILSGIIVTVVATAIINLINK